jgi:hypothetical protein
VEGLARHGSTIPARRRPPRRRGPRGERRPDRGRDPATARVDELGSGRRIAFATDDLPVLPKKDFYELWFVGPGDRPGAPNRISAGTFHPDPEGRSRVIFHAAVNPRNYPGLAVTREPGDGDPAPTGEDIMRGGGQG